MCRTLGQPCLGPEAAHGAPGSEEGSSENVVKAFTADSLGSGIQEPEVGNLLIDSFPTLRVGRGVQSSALQSDEPSHRYRVQCKGIGHYRKRGSPKSRGRKCWRQVPSVGEAVPGPGSFSNQCQHWPKKTGTQECLPFSS